MYFHFLKLRDLCRVNISFTKKFSTMKNEIKVARQGSFKLFLLALLLFPGVASFSASPGFSAVNCPIQGVTKTEQSTGSVTYTWSAVSGASAYKVYFVRLSDNFTSSVLTTGSTSVTFSGLPAGGYRFYFAAVCGQEGLEYILDDVLML